MKQPVAKKPVRRWPYFGRPQVFILAAAFGIWVGVALPWFVFRPLNVVRYASPTAASWVLWAGLMAIAGAVARWKVLAVFSALAGAGTAFGLAFWQMLVIFQRCGFDLQLRCIPGPGVFAVQVAAVVVLYQSYRIFTWRGADGDSVGPRHPPPDP